MRRTYPRSFVRMRVLDKLEEARRAAGFQPPRSDQQPSRQCRDKVSGSVGERTVAADLPPERGDGQARDAVLINPVCNAIKFTDAGEVVIKAAATTVRSICRYVTLGPAISAADVTSA